MSSTSLDLLIGGLAIGGVYGLVALGYSMIIRATGILHFAQGDVMMLGAMIGLAAVLYVPLPLAALLLLGMAFSGLVATGLEVGVYRTLRRRGVPLISIITATLGVSIALSNAARLIWGAQPLRYPALFTADAYQFSAVRVAPQLFWIMVMSVVLMTVLQLFLNRTRIGIAMQAVAQDAETAQLMGVDVHQMRAYTFGIGGMLAGAAGVMLGSMFFAYFAMGFTIGLKGFVAATLGGLGSIRGAIVGGFLFGLIETYSAVFVSSAYKDAIGMILLILLLLAFPSGLAGIRFRR